MEGNRIAHRRMIVIKGRKRVLWGPRECLRLTCQRKATQRMSQCACENHRTIRSLLRMHVTCAAMEAPGCLRDAPKPSMSQVATCSFEKDGKKRDKADTQQRRSIDHGGERGDHFKETVRLGAHKGTCKSWRSKGNSPFSGSPHDRTASRGTATCTGGAESSTGGHVCK